MKKWNVAIIGLGFVGKLHYDALRRLPNVHVRTIHSGAQGAGHSAGEGKL